MEIILAVHFDVVFLSSLCNSIILDKLLLKLNIKMKQIKNKTKTSKTCVKTEVKQLR